VNASSGSPPKLAGSVRRGISSKELEDRTRPSVQQQKRARRRPLTGHLKKMQLDAAERHLVLRKGVEPCFLGAPIKSRAPIFDELLQIADIGAVGPGCPGAWSGYRVRASRSRRSAIAWSATARVKGCGCVAISTSFDPTPIRLPCSAAPRRVVQHSRDRPCPTPGAAVCRRPLPRPAPSNRTHP
jgi:hypothetical protein